MRPSLIDQPDKTPVVAVETAYDNAWSRGDLAGMVALFTSDAVLVNPRGHVAVGTDRIRAVLGDFLAGEAKGSQHQSAIVRVSFVRPDVAVVDGDATITFDVDQSPVQHPFTDVLVKRGERWAITHVRAYQFAPPP